MSQCGSPDQPPPQLPAPGPGEHPGDPGLMGDVTPPAHPGSPPTGLQGDILTNVLDLLKMEDQRFPLGRGSAFD